MKDIVISINPDPPYNAYPITFDLFSNLRPLTLGGRVKLDSRFGWMYIHANPDDSSETIYHVQHWNPNLTAGILVETHNDLLSEGVSIYSETPLDFINRMAIDILGDTPYWICDESDLPAGDCSVRGKYLLNCWEMVDGHCVVNRVQAEAHHLDKIREARAETFKRIEDTPLYQEALRQMIRGDTTAWERFEVLKQPLRDLPTTFSFDGLATNDFVDAWPESLSKDN